MYKNFTKQRKWRFLMRVSFAYLFLLIGGIQLLSASNSRGQGLEDIMVTIEVNEGNLESLLKRIEHQTPLTFAYLPSDVQKYNQVTLKPGRQTVKFALDQALEHTALSYRSIENSVVIFPKQQSKKRTNKLKVSDLDRSIGLLGQERSNKKRADKALGILASFSPIELYNKRLVLNITGQVTDVNGEPLIGVNILVKGTNKGTTTDLNGEFSLEDVDEQAVLVLSYIGYQSREVSVNGQSSLSIIMQEDVQTLDEVVVVGYGSVKKSDLTGSVASVNSEELNAFPTPNVLQALTGRAAGVQVTQNNGQPGGSISVRIRGANSISGSNEPLYVVDGFPTSGSNPTILNNLDIASIEILKDASATAIFGSRGANGVVLITTKSGIAGKTTVHYESNFGIQSLRKKMDMMNAREYAEFYNIVAKNGNWGQAFSQEEISTFDEGFDWQDFVFRDAPIQNHNITVNGGNDKTKFSFSGSFFDEKGIVENSGYSRYTLRTSLSHDINDKLRIKGNIILSKIKSQNQSSSGGGRGSSLIAGALYLFPTITPWNEDGSWRNTKTIYNWAPELGNPALELYEKTSEGRSNKVLANASFEYEPIPDLYIKVMGGIENSDNRDDYYRSNNYIGTSAYASVSTSQFTSLLNENTISYNKTFGKHSLSGLIGFTYQDFLSTSLSASGTGFLSDTQESYNLGSASVPGIPGSGYSLSVILSGIGRVNYNFDDRFLATLNFRTDGSSKYSNGSKWGYFPSGSIAWRLSNEDFLNGLNNLSDLKLRLGWGTTGSQAIGAYATLNNLSAGRTVLGGQYYSTFAPGSNLPGDLKWETTEQTNIGMDAGLFNDRIYLTADYYMKKTRDLLNTVQLPPSGGFLTTVANVGEISNTGFELAINAHILSGAVKWSVDGNISFNRSKVDKLYKGEDILGSFIDVALINDHFNILREGEPFSVFYGYLDQGFDEAGLIGKYADLDGDGVINNRDKTIIGDPNPDFIYGLNSALSYKNFDFTIFLQGVQGNDIFNLAGINNTLDVHFGGNMPKEVLYDHWSPTNLNAKYPVPSRENSIRVSDRFIEDGSYLRVRNIQLAYNFPVSNWGVSAIKNIQVYVGGKNLITLTDYSRWDPEVNSLGGSNSINQGIDYHTYPVNKSINFGIRADF